MVSIYLLKLQLFILLIAVSIYTNKKMYNFYKILEFMRLFVESTTSMNESINMYIITGDNMYLRIFKYNADARIGLSPWTSIPDEVISYNGKQQSLKNISKEIDFNEEERNKFNNMLILYDNLLWLQIEALNIAQGFSDPDGTAKKKFDMMEQKTYIEFPVHNKTNDILNKKEALEFIKNNNFKQINIKADTECDTLNNLISVRLQNNFKIYGWIYFIFYTIIFVLCVIIYVKTSQQQNYEIGLTSIYNNLYMLIAFLMVVYGYKVYSIGIKRIHSYIVSNTMQEIVSDLTKNIRDYTRTNSEEYFDKYWKIVNIKNGKIPWSELSKNMKGWNILSSYSNDGQLIMPLSEMLEKSEFTQEELLIFQKASDENDSLIWKDIESFNWAKELWDKDNKGRRLFSQKVHKTFIQFDGKYKDEELITPLEDSDIPNNHPVNPKQKAVDNLYSNEYIIASNIIKNYTTEGETAVNNRMNKIVQRTIVLFYIICILFILIVTILFKRGVYNNIKLL